MLDVPFKLVLAAGLIGVGFEVIGGFTRSSAIRRAFYFAMIPLTAFASALLLAFDLRLASALVVSVAIFRMINAARAVESRMEAARLYHASRRSTLKLLVPQVALFGLWLMVRAWNISLNGFVAVLMVVSLLISFVFVFSTKRTLAKSRFRSSDKHHTDADLPTVSVCIPARNETEDLPICLAELIKSDYPKLEILVLDDCSQDRTSEIIKSFARDGVRFIAGEPPRKGWLAKNQAYQALAEAASGEIILFCGVDTRFGTSAIRTLVSSMIARNKQMISVLPKSLQAKEHAVLVQPMRYWWEVALPRRLFNRPPVLSTVWMISRQALFGRGEMKAVRNSILPEGYFARELTRTDEYSFMRSYGKLDIATAKKVQDQWQSAVRTRYPRLRQRPENVMIVLMLEAWLLALPLGIFIAGFFINLSYFWILAGVNTFILAYVHKLIMSAWGVRQLSLALALFPVAVVVEIFVTMLSMLRYEFSNVTWKDRDICIPVMRHYKKLPDF